MHAPHRRACAVVRPRDRSETRKALFMTMHTRSRARRTLTLFAASVLVLTGCASTDSQPAADAPPEAAESISITDAWVKAAPEGMTAAFGMLSNATDDEITIVSATTEVAEAVELHETVVDESGATKMREVEGGFTIPAAGSLDLEPGGNHLMLMGLIGSVEAGEEVSFTLTFADDTTMSFTAPVKDFSGAQEEYSNDDHADHGDHGEHGDGDHTQGGDH